VRCHDVGNRRSGRRARLGSTSPVEYDVTTPVRTRRSRSGTLVTTAVDVRDLDGQTLGSTYRDADVALLAQAKSRERRAPRPSTRPVGLSLEGGRAYDDEITATYLGQVIALAARLRNDPRTAASSGIFAGSDLTAKSEHQRDSPRVGEMRRGSPTSLADKA